MDNRNFGERHPVLTFLVTLVSSLIGAGIGIFLAALVDAMKSLGMI